jgi:hypothetical protein
MDVCGRVARSRKMKKVIVSKKAKLTNVNVGCFVENLPK